MGYYNEIDKVNNRGLYEYFLCHAGDTEPDSPEYLAVWKEYLRAFVYLNERKLIDAMIKYKMFLEPGKDRFTILEKKDASLKKPKQSFKKPTLPEDIIELSRTDWESEYVTMILSPEPGHEVVEPVLKECVRKFDPSCYDDGSAGFIVFFHQRLRIALRKIYTKDWYYEDLISLPWIVDDLSEDYDQNCYIAPGYKRVTSVMRYLSRLREKRERFQLENHPTETEEREFLRSKIRNYTEDQKEALLNLVFKKKTETYTLWENEKGSASQTDHEAEDTWDHESETDSQNLPHVSESEADSNNLPHVSESEEEIYRLAGNLIGKYLAEECSPEEAYIMRHYSELSDTCGSLCLGEAKLPLYRVLKYIREGDILSPEQISADLLEMGYEGWNAKGVVLRYQTLIRKINYTYSPGSSSGSIS